MAGLVVGLTLGLVIGPVVGLTLGLVVFAFGLVFGLEADDPDLAASAGPLTLIALDRRTFLMFVLAFGLAAGLVGGLVGGPVVGLAVGLSKTAWGDFVVVRAYLAVRHDVPWDLMAFLQDAHERRGVLRQVGAVHQFRHIDLQRHLTQ
ncbi:hypothetical protein FNH08_25955 [Streptomyces spongiae]|uniref:Uncharacterized protein n=1 Tax=Streptomyces spongiae TaxID=565072 RepID=A0A5N8XM07_9ACTN|nr:hypothetical protein [Streptomyces spongiae]